MKTCVPPGIAMVNGTGAYAAQGGLSVQSFVEGQADTGAELRHLRDVDRRYFECGVPRYGNSRSVSVCGFKPVGGHSFLVRKARR